MAHRSFTSDELNAYVDGEADPLLAAGIAGAAAADADLAESIAALALLKAATGTALEQDGAAAPSIRVSRARRGLFRNAASRTAALAASLVLLLVVGTAGWYLLRPLDSTPAWLSAGAAQYTRWRTLGNEPPSAGIDGRRNAMAHVSLDGAIGIVPDLSAAGLELAHFATASFNGYDTLFVGYLGRNGCRLGLWIGLAPEGLAAERILHRQPGGEVAATWRVGGTGYAAIARDMDEERFQAVTSYLHFTTRQAPGEREQMRMAGRRARTGAPCLVS